VQSLEVAIAGEQALGEPALEFGLFGTRVRGQETANHKAGSDDDPEN
jgi:hypothetical protein